MNCPICHKPMEVVRTGMTRDPRNSQEYDRVVYVCTKDDAWVTTDLPKEKKGGSESDD